MSGKPLEGDVREWLMLARADLAHAEVIPPGGLPEVNFFHAQQAAEKALKALLIHKGRREFPYTHDLKLLLDMLQESSVAVPPSVNRAPDLTRYAVSTRYPPLRNLGQEEFDEITTTARAVLEWVESQVELDG